MPTVKESLRPKSGDYPKSVQPAASSVSTTRSKSSTHRSSKSSAASHRQHTPQDPKSQTTNTLVDDYNKKRRPGATSTFSNSDKGSSSQHRAPRSARSSSKAPTSVHASECGSVASKYPNDQHAHIESWRQAVGPYGHEQQALVPFEQPSEPASTIKNRIIVFVF